MRWISEWLFKEHIEKMVEEKFQEKLLETYLHTRRQEHKARIARVRATLDNTSSRVSEEVPPKIQPSSRVRTGSAESKPQESTSAAAMKAKLLGIKK
jgi:hypothetical protein